ncbi:SCF E3 ubiquitin ligase complex F-box protein [Salix suchowensis]|nr:SCF E3 ubiquitin ligase complex F-box protein [Salix suchowensis]
MERSSCGVREDANMERRTAGVTGMRLESSAGGGWRVWELMSPSRDSGSVGAPELSDRSLILLAETSSNLQGLGLSDCRNITDVGILELTTKSLPLQWVHLNGVLCLTDPSISAIAKTCAKLSELDLRGLPLLTPLSIRDVWTYSRKLRSLRLARCTLLTDKAFPSHLGASEGSLGLTEEEKPLPPRPTTWIDKLPPLMLAHSADNLRVLDISYCDKITDDAVEVCRNLTDMSIFELASLSSLRRLNLTRVHKLTDIAVHTLAEHAIFLESLRISSLIAKTASPSTASGSDRGASIEKEGTIRFSDPPPSNYNADQQAVYRVFSAENIARLCKFWIKKNDDEGNPRSEVRSSTGLARQKPDVSVLDMVYPSTFNFEPLGARRAAVGIPEPAQGPLKIIEGKKCAIKSSSSIQDTPDPKHHPPTWISTPPTPPPELVRRSVTCRTRRSPGLVVITTSNSLPAASSSHAPARIPKRRASIAAMYTWRLHSSPDTLSVGRSSHEANVMVSSPLRSGSLALCEAAQDTAQPVDSKPRFHILGDTGTDTEENGPALCESPVEPVPPPLPRSSWTKVNNGQRATTICTSGAFDHGDRLPH